MTKLYLDMKFIGRIPGAFAMSEAEINGYVGMNLGNLVFRHALYNVLEDLADYTPVTGPEFRKIAAGQKVERVIVSCANWLGQTAQDERFNLGRAEMIEMVDGPVTAFGLGVQASGLVHDKPVRLGPNTIRLARALSDRCAQVSVRDELTRRTLEAAGIHNAIVTGCPSNYLNCDPALGRRLGQRAEALSRVLTDWSDVRTAISEVTGGHAISGEVARQQMRMLAETPAFYIVQTPQFVKFVLGQRTEISDFYRANNPFSKEPGRLTRTLKAKTLHFTDVDSWMDFSRTCDISVGMRIHGTMVPLQSGTPSLLIAHDSRTVGLAEAMNVPWISPEDFLEMAEKGPRAAYAEFGAKIATFDANRAGLARIMHGLLVANGHPPHRALLGLLAKEAPGDAA